MDPPVSDPPSLRSTPEIAFSSVLLPEPLFPRRTTMWPSGTSIDTPSSASTARWYRTLTSRSRNITRLPIRRIDRTGNLLDSPIDDLVEDRLARRHVALIRVDPAAAWDRPSH